MRDGQKSVKFLLLDMELNKKIFSCFFFSWEKLDKRISTIIGYFML